MNLHQIARALGGEVSNGQVLAPGPGHSRKDRSLSVRLSPGAPDGFLAFSHAGDDWRACRDYVRRRLGIAPERREHHAEKRLVRPPPRSEPSDARMRNIAREIFSETIEPRDTIVERYFEVERRLPNIIDNKLAQTVRFHSCCPFGSGRDAFRAPAIVCALRDLRAILGAAQALGELDDVERAILRDPELIVAIQRIQLSPDGKKVGRGMSLGPMGDAVIFCSSIWDAFYGSHACVAEGLETALTMRALGHEGAMALGGSGRFRRLDLPFQINSVTISGERDAASEKGWRQAGERWAREGRDVDIWLPPEGFKDANDVLRRAAS